MWKTARQFERRTEAGRTLRIGEVAGATGISVEALRFYERRGLLGRPARTASGYRAYDEGVLERLAFIKRAQSIGFSLDEIAEILLMRGRGEAPCVEVREAARRKLAELDARLRELRRYRTELARTLADWDERGIEEGQFCGLIEHSHVHAPAASATTVTPPARKKTGKGRHK
ncbi:MAG: MerR family transcriptional regulator, copper efflux regulator [Pyrinomonadaceae bacterium]|nr:MerR family transcriptional regulator, copper efflux regulator [Pyrinomonadaceae bacterium]